MRPGEPICVCVTGVGGGGLGEQLVKALRLAETPYRIVATDVTPLSAGLARGDAQALLPRADDSGYVPAVLDLCRRHGVRALLPGSEAELRALSDQREAVAAQGVFLPVNARQVIDDCLDKLRLFARLKELGIETPWFRRVTSPDDVDDFPVFPVVLKPSVGGGGSANVYIAQDADEARWMARYLVGMYSEFMAQEYVGRPDREYTVGVLGDMDGEVLGSIALRRQTLSSLGCRLKLPNRTGRAELGDTLVVSSGISQGEIIPCPEVTAPCEALAKALGSRGPCNIQLRLVDGEVRIFEINPRFSGTASLRAMAGFNEPDTLIRRHVLGDAAAAVARGFNGVIMRRLEETVVTMAASGNDGAE